MPAVVSSKLLLCQESALECYRRGADDPSIPVPRRSRLESLQGCCSSPRRLEGYEPSWFEGIERPLHVLLPEKSARPHASADCCHYCVSALPSGSIWSFHDGLLLTSPELTFVQLCQHLSLGEAVLLGDELCGSYSALPGLEGGFSKREPLCTRDSIACCLDELRGWKGVAQARRALKWVADWSASPRESVISTLLGPDVRLGGFGVGRLLMNVIVTDDGVVRPRQGMRTPAGALSCDLYVPSIRLGIEYESNEFHANAESLGADSVRRARLLKLGVETITITNRQVRNAGEFEEVAHAICRKMGMRVGMVSESARWKRAELRASLLSPRPPVCGG